MIYLAPIIPVSQPCYGCTSCNDCNQTPCNNCIDRPNCQQNCGCNSNSCIDRPNCQQNLGCNSNNCGCQNQNCESNNINCGCHNNNCACGNSNCGSGTISTIQLIENCPSFDHVIQGDEIEWIAANFSIHSTYNISHEEHQNLMKLKDSNTNATDDRHGLLCNRQQIDEFEHIGALKPSNDQTRKKGEILTNIVNNHSDKPVKICHIVSGWSCRKQGSHFHPTSCQKYIQCDYCNRNSVYVCPYDEAFDGKRCSNDWSECEHLHGCNYANEAFADPWNRHGYFICIRKKKLKNKYYVFRRHCPDGEIFNPTKQICYRQYNRPKPPPCRHGCVSYHG